LVDGASELAKKHNISDLTIGLTVVAFGTSAPELVVNVFASINNHQDIVYGNILGSNSFNLFIILGLAGIITPLTVKSSTVWKEIPLSLFAILLLFFLSNDFVNSESSILSRIDGLLLIVMFCLFIYYIYRQLDTDIRQAETPDKKPFSTKRTWVYIILGLTGLIAGGRLVVSAAVQMAVNFGISEKVVGLTIVAAGTSFPELATSIVAAVKKNNDIAVGNIIGSNIFNIFLILGISSLIRPLPYDKIFNTDMLLVSGGTFVLFIAMFTGKKKRLDRWEAGILFLIYVFYSIYLISC